MSKWTDLRVIKVRQVSPEDAVKHIRVPIDEPDKDQSRLGRVLHMSKEDFEALTISGGFNDLDFEPKPVDSVQRSASLPSPSVSEAGCEVRLRQFVKGSSTWVYCTPDKEEENAFTVRILVKFSRVYSQNLSWRLCRGEDRIVPEMSILGINSVDVDGVMAVPTPHGFKLELMPHQQRSLSWMMRRELIGMNEWCVSDTRADQPIQCTGLDLRLELKKEDAFFLRGGLLCDVVGSGKTATVLALVLQSSSYTYIPARCRSEECATSTKATLVLCPANVHEQWLAEVRKFCPDGFISVSLCTLDDVRRSQVAKLMEADLVVAPYDIFAAEAGETGGPIERLTLERMCWHRIVLDEFHELTSKRNPAVAMRNERILNALRSLEVAKRWGMSGTPESFLTLPASVVHAAQFFRCEVNHRSAAEFVEYFCRQARIKIPVEVHEHVVQVRQTADERAVYFQQLSEEQLPQNLDWSDFASRGVELRNLLMMCSHFTTSVAAADKCITAEEVCEQMLSKKCEDVRKMKQQLNVIACSTQSVKFSEIAQKVLDQSCIGADGKQLYFQDWSAAAESFRENVFHLHLLCARVYEVDMEENASFLELLVGLVDACKALMDSFAGLLPESETPALADGIETYISKLEAKANAVIEAQRRLMFFRRTWETLNGQAGGAECPICLENVDAFSAYTLFCGHAICQDCAPRLVESRCPVCRYEIPRLQGRSVQLRVQAAIPPRLPEAPTIDVREMEAPEASESSPERAHWSSKLCKFVETLESIRLHEPSAKVIVFTQWECLRIQTSRVLADIGVQHLSLEGDIFCRTHALQEFQSNQNISLLLLSLEHSASGTNLTVASHVFLMHPMLASSHEEVVSYEAQAVGRVVRLGQTRPVHVWRFITSCTVEERMWIIRQADSSAPMEVSNR